MNPKSGKVLTSSPVAKALTVSVKPMGGGAGADSGLTKIEKSPTELSVGEVPHRRGPGRPPRPTPAPTTWSVRGVTPETRLTLEQAARRAGKTLGQYLNEDLRHFAAQQLQPTPPVTAPPAATADLQAQVHYLRQLVENLAAMLDNQPPTPPPADL